MGKKKTYKLSEHEQQHNRVDYFRSVQIPRYGIQTEFMTMNTPNFPSNEYTNPSFLASTNDLNFPNRTRQNIWSTSQSYIPSERNSQYSTRNTRVQKGGLDQSKSVINKRCLIITLVVVIVVLIVGAAIGLGLAYQYYWKPKDLILKSCPDVCKTNEYCVSDKDKNQNSSCMPKPGYKYDLKTNEYAKTTCYTGYEPYTYLNNLPPDEVSPPETQFIKPYCCPNPNYLTNACCGMSRNNLGVGVSKRIIGGQTLGPGVFPWIVYVVMVYRQNPSMPLRMIRNCSGTLINESNVLTAAHCLALEDKEPQFNSEFRSIESMIRVYFGFIDKKQVFTGNSVNTDFERLAHRAIFHPKFDSNTLRNDLVVLKLNKPVYRDINADYLCLNTDTQDNSVNKLYTAGWGSTNPSHLSLNYPDKINYVDAVVFPMSFCKYIYPDPEYAFLFNSTTHVCAGYQAAVGKDTCYADSGSPLMVQKMGQWFMYGIVTFGSQPDCAQGPSMFTRISYYIPWINSVVTY